MSSYMKTVVRLWRILPRCWSYILHDMQGTWTILYIWLWGRKWEIAKIKGEYYV